MSEYEDLRNIQASMERLLHEEGELMGSTAEVSAGDFNGNPAEGQELFNSLASENDQDNNNMAIDDDDEADEDEEDDEGEEEEEEEEDCSNGSPADEDHSNNSQLNEEWHSGVRSLTHLQKKCYFSVSLHHLLVLLASITMSQKSLPSPAPQMAVWRTSVWRTSVWRHHITTASSVAWKSSASTWSSRWAWRNASRPTIRSRWERWGAL